MGRPLPVSVLYGTTFTLPFGTGACGFAATATATLPIGRLIGGRTACTAGGGVWTNDLFDLAFEDLVTAGVALTAVAAADVIFDPMPPVLPESLAAACGAGVFRAAGLAAGTAFFATGALIGADLPDACFPTGFAAGLLAAWRAADFPAGALPTTVAAPAAFLPTVVLGAAFLTAVFFVAAVLATAFLTAAFFTTAFLTTAFLTAAFLAAGRLGIAFPAGGLLAFFARALRATGAFEALTGADFFVAPFFTAAFLAAAVFFTAGLATGFFVEDLAFFFAVFLTATGGSSFSSLVTGKRAVIPCQRTCGNRNHCHNVLHRR